MKETHTNSGTKNHVKAAVAANVCGLSASTVYRLARQGRIPHIRSDRAVRFNIDDVVEALTHDNIQKEIEAEEDQQTKRKDN